MSRYYTFTAADAVEYARQFGGVSDPQSLISADEIGDGNLNLVFKIRDTAGISRVIVKQALPYVRCVGESWPLTLDRARIEAETLVAHGKFAPQHTVKVLHHDAELAVMVQEDLSDHAIWRSELVQGKHYPQPANRVNIWRRRCSTRPIFIRMRSLRKRKWRVSPTLNSARSPKISFSPILTSITSVIILIRFYSQRLTPCARIERCGWRWHHLNTASSVKPKRCCTAISTAARSLSPTAN